MVSFLVVATFYVGTFSVVTCVGTCVVTFSVGVLLVPPLCHVASTPVMLMSTPVISELLCS